MSLFGLRIGHAHATVLSCLLACMASMALCTGCATAPFSAQGQSTQATQQDAADKQTDSAGDAATPQTAPSGRTEGDAALNTWADECLDRRGDVTVYALAELKGGQLSALLLEQDYVWSERNQMWLKQDGSAAVVVNDVKGSPMANEDVAPLDAGSATTSATYRLVTSGYSSAKKAFEGLASRVMTCEDVEHAQSGTVGVLAGPSGRRCLVLVTKSDNVYVVTMAGEDAVATGLLDTLLGQELGTSVDEAFAALAGRSLRTPEA